MKRFALLAALAVLSLAPLAANALVITPSTGICGTPTCLLLTGNQTSQADINTAIAGALGASVELYKQNVAGSETGAFAASYLTEFQNDPLDPKDATIEYIGGDILSGGTHLLVKDGNQTPAWYLFKISWNGTEQITLNNFWPQQGAISHVTIYGTGDTTTRVPEPGTLALVGAGLLALGFRRRGKTT